VSIFFRFLCGPMGGPKWIKPQHGPRLEHHKKQRSHPENRGKIKRALGLPDFKEFEPERFKRQRLGLNTSVETGKPSAGAVASLQLAATRAEEDFARRKELEGDTGDGFEVQKKAQRDPTSRAYYKEFRKVVEQSDVLLEVIDARDPLGCRCYDVEKSVVSEFADKKNIVLVLNKVDLVPREVAEQWLAQLRGDFPVVAFTCLKGSITNKCIDCLHRLLNAYARTGEGGRRHITVGVIGYPNVGKSSVINALKRDVVVAVGNTPGFTKCSTEVQLNSHVTIMDCPGIVFSSDDSGLAASALRNIIKIEKLEDPIAPVELIVERCGVQRLQEVYGLPEFKGATDFLTKLALKKGKMGKRCEPLLEEAAKTVLKDWNDGAIPFYTLPTGAPPDRERDEAAVPTEFEQEYETIVVQGLPSLDDIRAATAAVPSMRYATSNTPRSRRSTRGANAKRRRDASVASSSRQCGPEGDDDAEMDDNVSVSSATTPR